MNSAKSTIAMQGPTDAPSRLPDRTQVLCVLETLKSQVVAAIGAGAVRRRGAHGAIVDCVGKAFGEAASVLASEFDKFDRYLLHAYGNPVAFDEYLSTDGPSRSLDTLTPAERRVLAGVVKGQANKIIAYELALSEATVKAHVSSILRKLEVTSRSHAIATVIRGSESTNGEEVGKRVTG